MNREEIKRYLDNTGYTKLSDHKYIYTCEIYYKAHNGKDMFVLFSDNTKIAGKDNIKSINQAIRNNDGIYAGNSREKDILNIIKVDDENEFSLFKGEDIVVVAPKKDNIGKTSEAFKDIIGCIEGQRRVNSLTRRKLNTMQGTLAANDKLPVVTVGLIVLCAYCYYKFHGNASDWAISPIALKMGMLLKTITAMFMHGSITHIIFNMLALLSYGKLLEKREGHAAMFITYMASGIASMFGTAFVSMVLGKMDASTVGASGAIYGIIGGCIVSEMLLPKGIRNPKNLITGTLYMLIMSAFMPNVDNTCHVIGLVTGIITMIIVKVIKRNANEAKYGYYSAELRKYGRDFIIPGRINW